MSQVATPTTDDTDTAASSGHRRGWALWLLRRLGLAVLTLWLVSVLVYVGTIMLGDPVRAILGKDYESSPARVAHLREVMNLDQDPFTRYLSWLGHLFTGDFGTALSNGLPVLDQVKDPLLNSLVLVFLAAIIVVPAAFALAMIAANARGKKVDHTIQISLLMVAGLPEFVIGILFVALFSTTVLHVFPAVTMNLQGTRPWDDPASLVLPVLTLVVAVAPYVARIVRATLVEVLDSDYVELARLKGVPEGVVVRKHALLNAIVPGIQVIALQLAWLAGGIVVTEYLFNYPGIGQLLVTSVENNDVPMVQALAMIMAAIYVVVNLVADVLSILFTPRARTSI